MVGRGEQLGAWVADLLLEVVEGFGRIAVDTDAGALKEAYLPAELAPLFAGFSGQVCTPSGSDGIRTRGLLRDRQAC